MDSRKKKYRNELKSLNKEEILNFGNKIDSLIDFSPAADYFYNRILEYYNKSVNNKLSLSGNNHFFDWMYAALVAWRMNRGKNRIIEFDRFRKNIADQRYLLMKLEKCTILNISEDEKKILGQVFRRMHIIETRKNGKYVPTDSVIVSNSKALHFILPNLVPPIDNAYTGELFSFAGDVDDQERKFIEIIEFYGDILKKLNISQKDLKNNSRYPKTIGKFMDDVVVCFIRSKMR